MKFYLLPIILITLFVSACGNKNDSRPFVDNEPPDQDEPAPSKDVPNIIDCTKDHTTPLEVSKIVNITFVADIAEPNCFKDKNDAIEFACTDSTNTYIVEGRITRQYPHFEQSALGLGNFTACYFQSVGTINPISECSKDTVLFHTKLTATACAVSKTGPTVQHEYSTDTLDVKNSMMTKGLFFPIKSEWYGPLKVIK